MLSYGTAKRTAQSHSCRRAAHRNRLSLALAAPMRAQGAFDSVLSTFYRTLSLAGLVDNPEAKPLEIR